VDDLREEWFAGVERVGVTSAASTPDDLVQEIVGWFRSRNPDLELIEEGEWEDIEFRQPRRKAPATTAQTDPAT
jgi:4-hydroxy-3-methylbut-2-enyl diphosphate reductase